ncbi:proteasome activator [Streptomyces sp. SID3343]|uniref:proteasome activator n=1 Tax=Streptomyces sp. SID3343 TaxID=2690260 RepID=UPI0013703F4C|nr:proteasome activator [Streptomyces sp. SID3343]MYV96790.1 DUF2587 domain-containing protein [Streptomyces sp. SID3343]
MADPIVTTTNEADDERPLGELVPAPDRVMRVAEMIRHLLEELRDAPLDEPGRDRVRAVYERSLPELRRSLAPDLYEELERLTEPFAGVDTPSLAELRIVQAQLIGWLEGLWGGIRLTLMLRQGVEGDGAPPAGVPAAEDGTFL